jgi:hypothetical protein
LLALAGPPAVILLLWIAAAVALGWQNQEFERRNQELREAAEQQSQAAEQQSQEFFERISLEKEEQAREKPARMPYEP